MSVATNISQIRAADDACDTGISAQVAAYGVVGYQPRQTEDLPDSFALTMVTLGQAKHLKRTPIGGLEFDIWEGCMISVELFCPRIVDASTEHGADVITGVYDLLGAKAVRARHALAPDRLDELNGRLSYHHITRLYPQGDVRGYDEERKRDRHELRYLCTIGVKPDSWPTLEAAYTLPAAP
jgi:hypothetical protein